MGNVATRKCACCKNEIVIDVDDVRDVVYFEGLYYHSTCFEEMAARKAASKRGKPQKWQDALDRLWELEAESKRMIEYRIAQDELNEWLLEHYDIIEVPKRFWTMLSELALGKYKQRKCKAINIKQFYECWKWGQRKLDEVAIFNKMNHKGPKNDTDRLQYDFAILISKYPLFIKEQSKMKVIRAVDKNEKKQPKIDYKSLGGQSTTNSDSDILDILDEIF